MKISIERLKQIIKEEVTKSNDDLLVEMVDDPALHSSAEQLLVMLKEMGYTDPAGMKNVLETALASLEPQGESEKWAWTPPGDEPPLQEESEE
jgi:hypothetical protein